MGDSDRSTNAPSGSEREALRRLPWLPLLIATIAGAVGLLATVGVLVTGILMVLQDRNQVGTRSLGGGELTAFTEACHAAVPVKWRTAKARYINHRVSTLGEPFVHEVTVDARDERPPDDQVITTGEDTESRQIAVKCRLAAKLEPANDEALEIRPTNEDWEYRDFTDTGVAQWVWIITPKELGDQELLLRLRPAIEMSAPEGTPTYGSGENTEIRFATRVVVKATPIQRLSHWFDTEWSLLKGMAALIVTAVVAVGGYILASKAWWAKFRATPEPPVEQKPASTPKSASKKKAHKK